MAKKHKLYFSVDVEAAGRTPGKYSMLSFGACIVGNTDIQFYRELQPISSNYQKEAMKIGCLGLKCLEPLKHIPEFNPKSRYFMPKRALTVLEAKGTHPHQAMLEFADWIIENSENYRPILAAAPIKFDGMFISWYFDNFYSKEDPFRHGGEDINSLYRGARNNLYAHISDLKIRNEGLNHNGLDDAIQQAKEMEFVLDMIKNNFKIVE
ncbi:hypothetical protein HOK51_03225 [Candidatus Woesearchaeota archaeon]|jgi:ribonuclease T|nr:hypothetical protein [Candidatus Woesearchaeota archaeon]MBT6518831.1 hypothetical protein [Candidatus Woesearchaeota archaeon]MBT7367970.1 hypothetical protein [Candidatus Woesearchaeota archaeon]